MRLTDLFALRAHHGARDCHLTYLQAAGKASPFQKCADVAELLIDLLRNYVVQASIYIYIYIILYMCVSCLLLNIYIYRRLGEWDQPGNRFVSFVRARGVVVRWECASNVVRGLSLFPFGIARLSLFPLQSSETNWKQVKSCEPSETQWNQVKPNETKWTQVKPSETKWSPSET